MAGKRQHYIPRLLQRGFLDDPAAAAERTWLHRMTVPAKLVGIRDIGVEDWFYSRKGLLGEKTLDDAITDFEGGLANEVASLRNMIPGSLVESVLAARIVTHLVMRTAHLRQTISAGMTSIASELETLLNNPQRLGSMMGVTGPFLGSSAVDLIQSRALELESFGFPKALSERLLSLFVREQGGRLLPQVVEAVAPFLPTIFAGLADKVRDTHNELLAKRLDDHGWVNRLSNLSWQVESAADIILPDPVALAQGERGVFEPLLFSRREDTQVVVLPLAHDRILLGRMTLKAVDLTNFNIQAAASCEGFFIAARSLDTEGLAKNIGSASARALTEAIGDAIKSVESTRHQSPSSTRTVQLRNVVRQDFSFQVQLRDFGDDVVAQEIASAISAIVQDLSDRMPLHDLDGVTIAADYHAALSELDLGDPNLPSVESGALEYGVGVAMPVSVIRAGLRKFHLVFVADVALGLISEDAARRSQAAHLLVSMLAGIAHSTQYPDIGFAEPDAMAREFHAAIAAAPACYWSARQAAFVSPEQGQNYAERVVDSLEYAQDSIEASRLRMQDTTDVFEPVSTAISCAHAVLSHAAEWLGHRDGLADGNPMAGLDLPEKLGGYGLDRWIELLGRDLAACYYADGSLNLNVVEMLGRHVERLFWCFGVFCWPEGEGVRCIVSDRPLRPPYFEPSGMDLFG